MKLINTIFFLLIFNFLFSQKLNWAYSIKNQVVQEGILDFSSNMNSYAIIGYGNNGVSMDFREGNTLYNSPGNFVAFYSNEADLPKIKWIKQTNTLTFGVFVDEISNVYTSGKNNGSSSITKYDSDGNILWNGSASIDGNTSEIAVKSNGNVIVSGVSSVKSTVTLSNNQQVDLEPGVYFLEFSENGNLIAANSLEKKDSNTNVYVLDLVIDKNDNVYACGQLDGQLDFNPTSVVEFNNQTNSYDAFVVKLDNSFGLKWFKTFGDSNNPAGWDKARAIKVDNEMNVYVGGEFTWTTNFDLLNNSNFIYTSDNNSQVPSGFLLKYDLNGNVKWANKLGNINATSNSDYASVSVKDLVLINGELIALLQGYGVVDMDPSSSTDHFESNGVPSSISFFVGEYLTDGTFKKSFSIGSKVMMSSTNAIGIEFLLSGQLIICGTFQKSVDFDPSDLVNNLECQQGTFYSFDNDLFLSSYQFDDILKLDYLYSDETIRCYPNPFKDEVNFDKIYDNVIIYNVNGENVYEGKACQKVNTNYFTPGIYIIELTKNNLKSTLKLVK
jgi:hypothetical protein